MTDDESIDCQAFSDKLHLYVGGDLDAGVLAQCDAHLSNCASCRGALERAQRARRIYFEVSHGAVAQDLDELQLDLWPAVREGLSREGVLQGEVQADPLALGLPSLEVVEGSAPGARRPRFGLLRGAALAAAAAVLAAVLWPAGPERPVNRGGAGATPAVAVSGGALKVNSEGGPAQLPGAIDPGGGPQPNGVMPNTSSSGGLQPVTELRDSLLYETLMSELLKDGSQSLDRYNTEQLASQIGLPLR